MPYYRWEPTERTWTVLCERWDDVIESGYWSLADAIAEVGEDECTTCAERQAEGRSGIPSEYAEC